MTGRARFTHFLQYLIAFCTKPGAVSDVLAGIFVGMTVPEQRENFVIVAQPVPEQCDPKTSDAAFSAIFRISINADRK